MKPEYRIRPFRMSDLDAVLAIERASFGADAYDRNLFAELSGKCGRLFLVAAAASGIRAYMVAAAAVRRATSSAELVSVAVAPAQVHQARRQNLRSALVATQLHLNISMRASEILVKMPFAGFPLGFLHAPPPRC